MPDLSLLQAIYERYPGLLGLLQIPEVGDLMIRSVNPQSPLSQQEFERQLHETNWWKTTPAPARDLIIRGVEDPATVSMEREQKFLTLTDWAQRLGVEMLGEERLFTTEAMLQRGENINTESTQLTLRNWLRANPDRIVHGGRLDGMAKQVAAIGMGEYFVPVDQTQARLWAIDMATGAWDEEALRARLSDHAMAMYPHLQERISKGETPGEIIRPLREVAAQELEISPTDINPRNAKWSWMFGGRFTDGENTKERLPTYSEVLERTRRENSARWWRTSKGRQTDASLTTTLLEAFGKRAF